MAAVMSAPREAGDSIPNIAKTVNMIIIVKHFHVLYEYLFILLLKNCCEII
jgi:hypothetical protein